MTYREKTEKNCRVRETVYGAGKVWESRCRKKEKNGLRSTVSGLRAEDSRPETEDRRVGFYVPKLQTADPRLSTIAAVFETMNQ